MIPYYGEVRVFKGIFEQYLVERGTLTIAYNEILAKAHNLDSTTMFDFLNLALVSILHTYIALI